MVDGDSGVSVNQIFLVSRGTYVSTLCGTATWRSTSNLIQGIKDVFNQNPAGNDAQLERQDYSYTITFAGGQGV